MLKILNRGANACFLSHRQVALSLIDLYMVFHFACLTREAAQKVHKQRL